MDKSSLLLEIDKISENWLGDINDLESEYFKSFFLPKLSSLAKKRRLPEGFVVSMFVDTLRGDGSIKELRRYYYNNKQNAYSSRTPAWVKIAITTLAKTD